MASYLYVNPMAGQLESTFAAEVLWFDASAGEWLQLPQRRPAIVSGVANG